MRRGGTSVTVVLPRTDLLSPVELARPGAFTVLRAEARTWFRSNVAHWQCAQNWAERQQALLARHGVACEPSVAESLEPYTPLLETELGYVVPTRIPVSTPNAETLWSLPHGEQTLALLCSSGLVPLRVRPGEAVLPRLRETATHHRPVTPNMLGWKPAPTSPGVLVFSLRISLPSGKKGSLFCGVRQVEGPFEEVVVSGDTLGHNDLHPDIDDADLAYLAIAERPARERTYRREQIDQALLNMSRNSSNSRFTL